MKDESDQRPDPDALLAAIRSDTSVQKRGRLKIYFGAAPGVGKTYAMLEAARREAKSGVDLVVGYVEPHMRPETQALLLGLEILPRKQVHHRGAQLFEFDLDAALARKPNTIVIDELAHTNAPTSQHAKRWQDVRTLLEAGVNVYTTLNVQHLESVNDVVAKIVGLSVRETVPDAIFDNAHEVELVDIAPEDLLERLREGKVYLKDAAERAAHNFFRKGNLLALRELALRKTADRVNVQVEGYRKSHGSAPTWGTAERLLVCVGPSPFSARLIRSAFRMASGLRCEWIAAHVIEPTKAAVGGIQLQENLQLAERLGARVEAPTGADPVGDILAFARANGVTKIIVGKPRRPAWREWLFGSFVYSLIRRCGDIDVYVITGDGAVEPSAPDRASTPLFSDFLAATLVVAACTAIGFLLRRSVAPVNLAMIYLLGTVGVSLRLGRGPSALAAVLGVAAFDFCFVPPTMTFVVEDPQYLFTFAGLLGTALVISSLMGRVRSQVVAARRRERRTAAQFALSRRLAVARTSLEAQSAIERAAEQAFDASARLFEVESDFVGGRSESKLVGGDDPVASWSFEHGERAGLATQTLPGAEALYLPLLAGREPFGVLRLQPRGGNAFADPAQMQLAEAFADQLAAALERIHLAAEARRIEVDVEAERLRNALLSSVSHDLRTPLAAIAGAAGALLDQRAAPDQAVQRELLTSILQESEALNRLVASLLDATRLEANAVAMNREWQSVEELVGAALQRLEPQLVRHRIVAQVPKDVPLVRADGPLLQQAIVHLVDNAVKYSPVGSEITISAAKTSSETAPGLRIGSPTPRFIEIAVADRGHGLPAGAEQAIFEKFARHANRSDREGFGLGLSICRAIVRLHGGRIWAENRPGGGAVFRFTLPIEPIEPGAARVDLPLSDDEQAAPGDPSITNREVVVK